MENGRDTNLQLIQPLANAKISHIGAILLQMQSLALFGYDVGVKSKVD
jgi:hypothetical protein